MGQGYSHPRPEYPHPRYENPHQLTPVESSCLRMMKYFPYITSSYIIYMYILNNEQIQEHIYINKYIYHPYMV